MLTDPRDEQDEQPDPTGLKEQVKLHDQITPAELEKVKEIEKLYAQRGDNTLNYILVGMCSIAVTLLVLYILFPGSF